MQALIIEDEQIAASRLEQLIKELAPEMQILAQLHSVVQAREWLNNHPLPDLIFLDIQLNDGYGFDILDALEDHPPIIFTTAYNEYAIRGFKYNGLDYLLKPIDKRDLQLALAKFKRLGTANAPIEQWPKVDKLKEMLTKSYKKRFMVKVGNQFNTFKVTDIAYFKSDQGLIFLYNQKGQKYPVEYSLDQLEEILDPVQFFRINRKYMVTVDAVEEIHTYFNSRLLLRLDPSQTDQVIVSRERTTNFKRWLDL